MQDRNSEQDAKTPVLADIPGVGALFRHKLTEETKSELVILLRPLVIGGDEQWAEAFRQSGQNVERLTQELEGWKDQRNSGLGYGKPSH